MQKTVSCHHNVEKGFTEVAVDDLAFRPSIYGIIIQDDAIVLLPQFGDGYNFPGGGVEKGEELEEALKREVREETGLDVTPDMSTPVHVHGDFFIDDYNGKAYHSILMYFICYDPRGTISTEGFDEYEKKYAQKARWVPLTEIEELLFYAPVNAQEVIRKACKYSS